MKIPHGFLCDYLTQYEGERHQHSWDANAIVRAIKGEPFNGYVRLKDVSGVPRNYTQASSNLIAARILKHLGHHLIPNIINQNVAFVPIPNSTMIPGSGNGHRIIQSAQWLCEGHATANLAHTLTLQPNLRWREPKTPAHTQGRARHPSQYDGKLQQTERAGQPILLFDDVYTSGSQVKAATKFLTDKGETVIGVMTVAKTTHIPSEKPILRRVSECVVEDDSLDAWDF